MTIVLQTDKGQLLTPAEADENIRHLRDGDTLQIPKDKGLGLKVDSKGTPTFPWKDIIGDLKVYGDAGDASRTVYRGGIKALQFSLSDQAYIDFHIPHDYAPGSDIHVHVHWSHSSATLTGGSCTWAFEMIYAKGHNQGAFSAPVTASVVAPASTTQYQHVISETIASVPGGSGVAVPTEDLEADGILMCRVYLDSNDLTDSVATPAPFAHTVDIHYQSTGVGTKNRNIDSGDFWT